MCTQGVWAITGLGVNIIIEKQASRSKVVLVMTMGGLRPIVVRVAYTRILTPDSTFVSTTGEVNMGQVMDRS